MIKLEEIPEENPPFIGCLFPLRPDPPMIDQDLPIINPQDRIRIPHINHQQHKASLRKSSISNDQLSLANGHYDMHENPVNGCLPALN
jgi:hypothetical protein